MMNVLVVMPFEDRHKEYIEAISPECHFTYTSIPNVTQEQVMEADIIFGNVPGKMLAESDRLQWIQLNSAGADAYCKPGILKENTWLTCATGAYGISVSEWMVAASFMLCRKMDLYMRHQVDHEWIDEGRVSSVWNSTTLILGLGDIGGEYAKRMKALGSYCIGVRRKPSDEIPEYLDELHTVDELDELIPRADFIALILPGTPETNNILDERRLRMMKPGAFVLNAGRGNSVDCNALMDGLKSGRIGGAALDVIPGAEPLPADSPLWDAPRCIVCPHIAGKFNLPETFERIVKICGSNLELFLQGKAEQMQNIVDPGTGYRKR